MIRRQSLLPDLHHLLEEGSGARQIPHLKHGDRKIPSGGLQVGVIRWQGLLPDLQHLLLQGSSARQIAHFKHGDRKIPSGGLQVGVIRLQGLLQDLQHLLLQGSGARQIPHRSHCKRKIPSGALYVRVIRWQGSLKEHQGLTPCISRRSQVATPVCGKTGLPPEKGNVFALFGTRRARENLQCLLYRLAGISGFLGLFRNSK